ncbi:unnamed protein product [Mytilus edulis]|uniref:Uncharacterized protein n=1 Tax=Mytilus edulis TaxID=6550 RepID=A0A8S3SCD4_MYTED|nr:unnamed protein product [Mytilus edulis]
MHPVYYHSPCCQQQPSPQTALQLLEMNSLKDNIRHIEETRQLNKRIQELEINNINHRITPLEASQQNIGYIQQQYRPPFFIRPTEHPWYYHRPTSIQQPYVFQHPPHIRPPPPIYNHIPTYGQNFAVNQSASQNWRDSRSNSTIHKTDGQNVTKELPTQRTLANWTAAFPQKTKEVHRATYEHVSRDQVDVIGKRIEDAEVNGDVNMYINIASYNCKNSASCKDTLYTMAPVICRQEHWLLGKSIQGINYKIRSVNDNNPIPPTQKARGYGGTAVVWSNQIDHIVDDTIEDGS